MKEKKYDKRLVAGLIVGVVTILTLVIGATYAYFSVSTTNNFGTSAINATAETLGSVSLVGTNATLSLNLTGFDMMRENYGEYYATETGTPSTDYYNVEIGHTSVTGSGYYNCNYTLNITASASSAANNLYTAFQGMSVKSSGQIYLNITNNIYTNYDFYTANLFPITVNGTLYDISAEDSANINASLMFANLYNKNQNALQGKDITITITATNFSCVAESSSIEYYQYPNSDDYGLLEATDNITGLNYYLKEQEFGSGNVKTYVCGIFNGTEVCLKGDDWENVANYKSRMESLGATCNQTYLEDGYLECSRNGVSCALTTNRSVCSDGNSYC